MAKFKGSEVKLIGDKLEVGAKAPEVTLVDTALKDTVVGGESDKNQLIIVVPSLDTDVCAKETREFNKRVSSLDIADIFVVSMDLPFASKRFCATEGIDRVSVVSDYVEKDFGKSYGVLIGDSPLKGLLTRAIFVVNEEGILTYKEIVEEITDEPNYEAALDAVKDA